MKNPTPVENKEDAAEPTKPSSKPLKIPAHWVENTEAYGETHGIIGGLPRTSDSEQREAVRMSDLRARLDQIVAARLAERAARVHTKSCEVCGR